ncbi:solute carrier organic anion transporter family member 6A1-like [Arvicola amphibius]|uniref:solute carrier organic anion transporter family member 6A1-like n=1 Tax=Arvicola amphibius TaxID=1047088 RepID=UPI001C0A663E|nr:solute carrier organic anion transporter family member 6A1-like [Arvicola amphibius]
MELSEAKKGAYLKSSFGLGPLVFPALQRFNNIDTFLAFYCVVVLAQGLVFGLVDLSTGYFEKEFYMSSPEKLALSFSYDLTSLLAAIFVAYYGSRYNRSKWVAAAAFLVGLGSILCALPFMKYEIISQTEESEELCIDEESKTIPNCLENLIPHRSEILYFFILGQCLQGIAGMPIYILGVTFLYDHSATHSAGIYLGIGEAVQVLGYGLGFIVGSPNFKPPKNQALNRLINLSSLWQQINWWAGFVSATLLVWVTLIPLLCFPSSLPGANKIRLQKEKESSTVDKNLKYKKFGPRLKDLVDALQCLLKSPLFICHAMCKATESLAYIGAAEFLPKYLENQFLLMPSRATLLTGIILIPGGAIGNLLGGLIVSKLRMSCKGQMKFVMVTSIISLLLFVLISFVECDAVQFAGISENYEGSGKLGNLTAPCNKHCGCTSSKYASVCGRDDVEYFSSCFAGCISLKELNNEKTYYNCSCIKKGLANADSEGDPIDAIPGKCNTKCHTLPLFFAFFFSSIVFSSSASTPISLIILQTLPNNLKSLGMGVTYTALRLFGSIPGPLLFRLTASSSCIYWDISKCGSIGHCWIYSKTKMALILLGLLLLKEPKSLEIQENPLTVNPHKAKRPITDIQYLKAHYTHYVSKPGEWGYTEDAQSMIKTQE